MFLMVLIPLISVMDFHNLRMYQMSDEKYFMDNSGPYYDSVSEMIEDACLDASAIGQAYFVQNTRDLRPSDLLDVSGIIADIDARLGDVVDMETIPFSSICPNQAAEYKLGNMVSAWIQEQIDIEPCKMYVFIGMPKKMEFTQEDFE